MKLHSRNPISRVKKSALACSLSIEGDLDTAARKCPKDSLSIPLLDGVSDSRFRYILIRISLFQMARLLGSDSDFVHWSLMTHCWWFWNSIFGDGSVVGLLMTSCKVAIRSCSVRYGCLWLAAVPESRGLTDVADVFYHADVDG